MPEYGWNEYEQLFHETKRSSWSTCARRQLCYCYSRVSNRYFCCDCDNGACFPSLSIVNIKNRGQRYMSQLRVNDFVLTVSDSGETKFTRVLGFLDRRTNVQAAYIHITTASNESLSISRRHLLFVKKTNSTESDLVPIFAGDVRIGDEVIVPQEVHDEGLKTISVKIIKINVNIMEGAFVPVTESGTLLVDDVLVSCYATIDHYVSHMVLAPMRWFPKLFENEESQFNDGIRTYAKILKYFGRKVLPRSLLASDDNEMIIVRRPNIQSSYDIFTEQLLCKFKYFINIIV
ncbi:SHH (predicted) [Pycnogonum litorale]